MHEPKCTNTAQLDVHIILLVKLAPRSASTTKFNTCRVQLLEAYMQVGHVQHVIHLVLLPSWGGVGREVEHQVEDWNTTFFIRRT